VTFNNEVETKTLRIMQGPCKARQGLRQADSACCLQIIEIGMCKISAPSKNRQSTNKATASCGAMQGRTSPGQSCNRLRQISEIQSQKDLYTPKMTCSALSIDVCTPSLHLTLWRT
jgi:hypothetical protein